MILHCIIGYLENAFLKFQVTDPTLCALLVFDTFFWPDNRAKLATYREDKIHHLVQHFRPLLQRNNLNFKAVQEELSGLKVCISNNFIDLHLIALWKVFNSYSNSFCNILMIVKVFLILPLTKLVVNGRFLSWERSNQIGGLVCL